MEIRAEEISQIIRTQIKDYEKKVEVAETGTVLSVGDGIARVYGVEKCMAMELLEFPGKIYGIALNLEEDNVGCAILGEDTHIKEGDIVKRTRASLRCRLGTRSSAGSSTRWATPSTARAPSRPRNSAASR